MAAEPVPYQAWSRTSSALRKYMWSWIAWHSLMVFTPIRSRTPPTGSTKCFGRASILASTFITRCRMASSLGAASAGSSLKTTFNATAKDDATIASRLIVRTGSRFVMSHNHLSNIALFVLSTAAAYGASNPVNTWNELAVQVTLTAGEGAVPESRTLPMVQIAIHDALNSIEHRYQRYAFKGEVCRAASPDAAIAVAAHDALVGAITVATSTGFGTAAQQANAVLFADAERDAELAAPPVTISRALESRSERPQPQPSSICGATTSATSAAQVPSIPGTAPGDWQPTSNPDPRAPRAFPAFSRPHNPVGGW